MSLSTTPTALDAIASVHRPVAACVQILRRLSDGPLVTASTRMMARRTLCMEASEPLGVSAAAKGPGDWSGVVAEVGRGLGAGSWHALGGGMRAQEVC
jgi:hypothetical protein